MEKTKLKPGDLIWADRSVKRRPYHHCGIYVGAGYVIHFAALDNEETDPEKAIVHCAAFEKFKDDCPVKLIDVTPCLLVEDTLDRAKECIGEKDYNIATFNCDHFATWCKTGEYCSIQINEIKKVLKSIDNPFVNFACNVLEIFETFNGKRLDEKINKEIDGMLEIDSKIDETIQPSPEEEPVADEYKIIDEDESDNGEASSRPLAWYEKVADKIKTLVVPISAFLALDPRLRPFSSILGAVVPNAIDLIVTGINVVTGKQTLSEAINEKLNNKTALLGSIVGNTSSNVSEFVKTAFGKIGSVIKDFVIDKVTKVVPAPVAKVLIQGAQEIGRYALSKIGSFLPEISTLKRLPVLGRIFS